MASAKESVMIARNASIVLALLLAACSRSAGSSTGTSSGEPAGPPFGISVIATLDNPWAMAFLPDGRMLVTEKAGRLVIVTQDGKVSEPLEGVPVVADAGQGGLADVVLHPDYTNTQYVYLSYAEPGPDGTAGLAVGRGKLTEVGLEGFQVI